MKKLIAMLIVSTLLIGVLSACSTSTKVLPITAVVGGEAQSLDPAINQSADGATYIVHLFEGLMKVAKDLSYVPGVAEAAPTVSADGLVYTFKLRTDAKWSDGKTLVAGDFVYAWQRAVDPVTASAYAYQLYYIKNATGINGQFVGTDGKPAKAKLGTDGKPAKFKYDADKKTFTKDTKGNYIADEAGMYVADPNGKYVETKADGTPLSLSDLGVKAVDDKTLEVTLEAQCPYFNQIVAFPTLFPVRKDVIEKDPAGWFSKPATCIGNGPYVLSSWVHKSKITMTKSTNYYDAASITADKLEFLLMDDNNAVYAAYKQGKINVVQTVFPSEETPALVKSGDCKIFPSNGNYYYAFNTQKAPFDNVKVRKALSLSIDRQYIIDTITKGGQVAAGAFVPPGMQDVAAGSDFRTVGGNYLDPSAGAVAANITQAKALMKEAGYENGKGFPKFEIKYNTNTAHQKIAEYIIAQWKTNLGITATLVAEDFPKLIADRNNGTFSVARDAWVGDYNDPMTFLDLCTTDSGNNDSHFKKAAFDALIKTAKSTSDATARMKAMHDAEKILLDEMAVMPIYFRTDPVLIKGVKDVVDSPLGYLYLMWSSKS